MTTSNANGLAIPLSDLPPQAGRTTTWACPAGVGMTKLGGWPNVLGTLLGPSLVATLLALLLLTTHPDSCDGQRESQLRLGKAINIFIRYGYLSISMKVISYNDSETWLFKEPTKNIFKVGVEVPCVPMKTNGDARFMVF